MLGTWTSAARKTQEDACWLEWKKGGRRISSARKASIRQNYGPTAISSTARQYARPRSRRRRQACLARKTSQPTTSRASSSSSSEDSTVGAIRNTSGRTGSPLGPEPEE
eukprot:14125132-Heterocapsa_arctica.AAC.1